MIGIVVSTATCTTRHPDTGMVVRLRPGQLFAADDPLVVARPGLFEPVAIAAAEIEQASKAPGEKRRKR